jgi:hypothetical protein
MTIVSCKLTGGLGTQLFQIFATISMALSTHKIYLFPYSTDKQTYWYTFLDRLRNNTTWFNPESLNQCINSLQSTSTDSKCLDGLFRSYKYFETHYETIIKIIDLRTKQAEITEKSLLLKKTTVSLHFRLFNHRRILSMTYYISSLNHIIERVGSCRVICFYEKENHSIIKYCIQILGKRFPTMEFVEADVDDDWEQMLLMSVCNHNIIANSSFSWWGAYFNTNPEKIVCCSSIMTEWCHPPEWNIIVS